MCCIVDEVEFGEVAMEPPSLSAKPRKAVSSGDKARVKQSIHIFKYLVNQIIIYNVKISLVENITGLYTSAVRDLLKSLSLAL